MALKPTPGWQANNNGRQWELDIMDRFKRHGYEQWSEPPTLIRDKPYFVRQYKSPYKNPYGEHMKLDFYIYHPMWHRDGLILECKFQDETGSVDEKLYFTVAAMKSTGVRGLLLLMGPGFRRCAIRYCEAQQDDSLVVLTSWDALVRMFNTGQL